MKDLNYYWDEYLKCTSRVGAEDFARFLVTQLNKKDAQIEKMKTCDDFNYQRFTVILI